MEIIKEEVTRSLEAQELSQLDLTINRIHILLNKALTDEDQDAIEKYQWQKAEAERIRTQKAGRLTGGDGAE